FYLSATILRQLWHCITPLRIFSVSCNFIRTRISPCRSLKKLPRRHSGPENGNDDDAERTARPHARLSRFRRANRGDQERGRYSDTATLHRGKPASDRARWR